MPRSTPSIPKYALHKPSGLARVRIGGRDVYLGSYGSPESKEAYNRVIAEHLAGGTPTTRAGRSPAAGPMTIAELILRYADHRVASNLSPETFAKVDRPALRRLRKLYGSVSVSEFDPSSLRAVQRHALVEEGLSRQYVNKKLTPVIKRLFKWGLAQGVVPADVITRLSVAEPIKLGEFGARETKPVRAIDDDVIERTIAEMEPITSDMVRVQRLTGMRPGEVCMMRWADIDTDGDIWVYRPERHKNAHRGHARVITLGPKAQTLLMYYTNSVNVLNDMNLWHPPGDLAEDYLLFKKVHEELAGAMTKRFGRPFRLYDVQHVFWFRDGNPFGGAKPVSMEDTDTKRAPAVRPVEPAAGLAGLPQSYVPPIVSIIPRLAMNDPSLEAAAKASSISIPVALEIRLDDFKEFIELYRADDRRKRKATWSEDNPDGRWRAYTLEEILRRDKASMDLFWLRDESLDDGADLPEPGVLAAEIADDLQAALEQFASIAAELKPAEAGGEG